MSKTKLTAKLLRKNIGNYIRWEFAHDRNRGTYLYDWGVIESVEGRNLFLTNGDVKWFPDSINPHISDPEFAGVPCSPKKLGWSLEDRVVVERNGPLGLIRTHGFVSGAREYPSGHFGLEIVEKHEDVFKASVKYPWFSMGHTYDPSLCRRP